VGLLAAVTGGASAWAGGRGLLADKVPAGASKLKRRTLGALSDDDSVIPGGGDWRIDTTVNRPSSDSTLHITGYASATSVNLGEAVDFHVSMRKPGPFWIEVYRMGFYGGQGARRMKVSPKLSGLTQYIPKKAETLGTIACGWPSAWQLSIPDTWMSGYYLAVFTTSDGYRSYTPFVVRDDSRTADLCVVVPFATYQAYNLWPKNGTGKSLYYGYKNVFQAAGLPMLRTLQYGLRAFEVSFDRPYSNQGLPANWDLDIAFISWAEQAGYNMVFAGSHDLHEGRIDPKRYKGLVFSGHDEYWSKEMRAGATAAANAGKSLIFLSANNIYWHVRMPQSADGRDCRLMTCYKGEGFDPVPGPDRTARWREPSGPFDPEQHLLGVQFNGILTKPVPLVVREQEHWFWRGTGVRNGDEIPDVVGAEADGLFAEIPYQTPGSQVLLSASPYSSPDGQTSTQNTSIIEADNGAIIFAAGSLTWPRSLLPEGDPRIQVATANVLDRVVGRMMAPVSG
jgi:hypothetical protein